MENINELLKDVNGGELPNQKEIDYYKENIELIMTYNQDFFLNKIQELYKETGEDSLNNLYNLVSNGHYELAAQLLCLMNKMGLSKIISKLGLKYSNN